MSAEHGSERRRFPRVRSACKLRVKRIGASGVAVAGGDSVTVNISGGGLCYRSAEEMSAGEFLAVEMALPEFNSPIVALGRVAYCEPGQAGFEIGIEFWWVGWGDDSAQRAISDWIKTRLAHS